MKWILVAAFLQAPPTNLKVHVGRTFCQSPNQCYQTVWGEKPWIDPKDIKLEYEEEVINGKVWGWGILAQ